MPEIFSDSLFESLSQKRFAFNSLLKENNMKRCYSRMKLNSFGILRRQSVNYVILEMGCKGSKNENPPTPVDNTSGYDYRIQFFLVGPELVGKTAIMNRFVENRFSTESEKRKIFNFFFGYLS
jgi:hypothetical protein